MIKIAIGCTNHLFGEGLKSLLESDRDTNVIGIFEDGPNELTNLKAILKLNPDIILSTLTCDFNIIADLPEDFLSGKQLKILFISDRSLRFIADKQLKDLISKGVVGILPPSADADLLRKAIKAVIVGELWLDRNTLLKIMSAMRHPDKNTSLAKREKEIIFHICQGFRNKEIAQKLQISEQTVKSHCNRIYRKLGVSDRLQLALLSQGMLHNRGSARLP